MSTSSTLAIRFGTGLSPTQPPPPDAASLRAALAGPDRMAERFPIAGFDRLIPLAAEYTAAFKERRTGTEAAETRFKAARRALEAANHASLKARLLRGVLTPDGFRERLDWFWADHFTVAARNFQQTPRPSAYAEAAIRPHVAGRFRTLLRHAATHPVMLAYLDQDRSVGPASKAGLKRDSGINENLAREILELHTLGVGAAYTQGDVTEFAELLTGLGINGNGGFVFRPNWAEPGAELVLGRRYGGREAMLDDIFAALDDIADHPATAAHISRKLAVHFVADAPDPDLVGAMTDAWLASGGDLARVYGAMLAHPVALAPERTKVRQPWEYIVAALRALGTGEARIAGFDRGSIRDGILRPLARMGQPYQASPGPDGWPEEAEAWITPPALAERIDWAMKVKRLHGDALPGPADLIAAALGDTAPEALTAAVRMAESRRSAVGLVLASAEFNRR